jgi:hypothetical protein
MDRWLHFHNRIVEELRVNHEQSGEHSDESRSCYFGE